ncbi:biosynthetic protein [Pseudoalteromonas peptidolytica F12-50-A1]|uniref:Biosynthetic protein n=1 Tax=Pseudoalteromonas peptidolytica F12-50-A1 TaxID=1315280 RepID=A0A8I0T1K0_9GAMM|nr:biosynthetic protein [Pseudoalteromonas peptidolytica F12-50-A1]
MRQYANVYKSLSKAACNSWSLFVVLASLAYVLKESRVVAKITANFFVTFFMC